MSGLMLGVAMSKEYLLLFCIIKGK